MSDPLNPSPPDPSAIPRVSARPIYRRKRFWLAIALILWLGYCGHSSPDLVSDLGGRRLVVFNYTVSSDFVLNVPHGTSTRSRSLQVGYWDERPSAQRLAYARIIAPYFLLRARQFGVAQLKLIPSSPWFTREFPVGSTNITISFALDSSSGRWVEQPSLPGETGPVEDAWMAPDDSVARLFLDRLCRNDSTGFALLADTTRTAVKNWSAMGVLHVGLPLNCAAQTFLLAASPVDRQENRARLSYIVTSAVDSGMALVDMVGDEGRRGIESIHVSQLDR